MKSLNLKIILILFSFLLFLNSLWADFVFDDRDTVLGRKDITSFTNIPLIFFTPYFQNRPQAGIYRPLVMVSFIFDYLWFKTNKAFSFHLTNIFLNSLNTLLIFILIKKLFNNKKLAFLTALLFSAHPLHTEAVSWISGRPELLVFLFSSLSILFFLKQSWILSSTFLLLALFSKETAVVLYLFYLFYWWFYLKKKTISLNQLFLLFLVSVIYFSLRWLSLGKFIFSNDATVVENPLKFVSFSLRIFTSLKIITLYLLKLIFPLKLSADYSFNQIPVAKSFWQIQTFFGFLILLSLTSFIFVKKVNPIIKVGFGFFFFPLLLISNLISPIGTIMAERLMYFPSLGFCLILAFGLLKLIEVKKLKLIGLSLSILLITFWSLRTFLRNFDWQNEFSLYQTMARSSTKSVLARSNLGGIYLINQEWQKAKEELLIANQICECYPHALNNLGLVYQHEADDKKAEEWFKKAIQINPNYQLAYKNLGSLYFNQGKFELAKEQLEIILPQNKNNQQLLNLLTQINQKLAQND